MKAHPPRLAEWLITRSLRSHERDAVLGDLSEEYFALAEARDARTARRWYRRQLLTSLLPNLKRRIMSPSRPMSSHHKGGYVDVIFQDVRFAWRMIWRRPTMTSVALASLVVGISLSATVFALLNAVLLRPLPVRNPNELAVVLSVRPDGMNHNFSYPDFVDYRSAQRSFTGMFAVSGQDVTMQHPAGSQIVAAELVSGGYFDILGVRPIYGRGISLEDDQPSAAPVALVSQAVWEDLGGNPDQFTPRTVTLNTHAFSIVGVVAPPYRGMEIGRDVRVWVPLHAYPLLAGGESILNRTLCDRDRARDGGRVQHCTDLWRPAYRSRGSSRRKQPHVNGARCGAYSTRPGRRAVCVVACAGRDRRPPGADRL